MTVPSQLVLNKQKYSWKICAGGHSIRLTIATVIFLFALEAVVDAQISQFFFDSVGNLVVQTAQTSAPPQIIGQPQNQVVSPGEVASFSVLVVATRSVSYDWRFNGNPIIGGTSEAL